MYCIVYRLGVPPLIDEIVYFFTILASLSINKITVCTNTNRLPNKLEINALVDAG